MKPNEHGKIIVIDGLDGCGKSTQLKLVSEYFSGIGKAHKTVSFPDYDSPGSALVKMYLAGELAKNAGDINAYAASSFYAADRYASFMTSWGKDYLEGTDILSARYISSNAIHQMVKLDKSEWDGFIDWLYDFECSKLGLPDADLVIYLDMPVEISQTLLFCRYEGDEGKKDIHEADIAYLFKCREAAVYAAKKLGWRVVPCSLSGEALPVEVIFNILKEIISEKLNA